MENLDQVFNPESNSFWNLLLALGVVVASFFLARLARDPSHHRNRILIEL